jgi:hypothetical protein
MALTITDTEITSATADEYASLQSDGRWFVTCRPGKLLNRNQAITAMTIAEEVVSDEPNWDLIAALESELH